MSTEKISVMIEENRIKQRVNEICDEINKDFGDEPLVVICILKGAFVFMADVVRQLKMPVEVHFMKVSSYGSGTSTTGSVNIKLDIDSDINGKNVLIIEDIIDSGYTMHEVRKLLKGRGAKCLKLCSCLSKPSRREVEVDIEYLGFEIPDKFVVGYGLDYDEKYRTLPYIGVVEISD